MNQQPPTDDIPAYTWLAKSVGDFLAAIVGTGKRGLLLFLGGAAAGVVAALAIPKQYTSTATFITQSTSTSSFPVALQGLAASIGLDNSGDFSPKFYSDLFTSRPVLMQAINHQYAVAEASDTVSQDYMQIEGFDDGPLALRLEAALKHLSKRVSARADVRTNVVTVFVVARYPQLAHDIAVQLLSALDSVNIYFRRQQSHGLREFYETRVAAANTELEEAEDSLRVFQENNRTVDSPPLILEQARLQRQRDLKYAVYQAVVQQYDEARIQEARTVPVLTILTKPYVPVKKSGPPRRLIVVACALLGFALVFVHRGLTSFIRQFRRDHESTWNDLTASLRRRQVESDTREDRPQP